MSTVKIDLMAPVRHDPGWAVTIWRGTQVEWMGNFATERAARGYLRRAGYAWTKTQVPTKTH
jgi:hypothetical protein